MFWQSTILIYIGIALGSYCVLSPVYKAYVRDPCKCKLSDYYWCIPMMVGGLSACCSRIVDVLQRIIDDDVRANRVVLAQSAGKLVAAQSGALFMMIFFILWQKSVDPNGEGASPERRTFMIQSNVMAASILIVIYIVVKG